MTEEEHLRKDRKLYAAFMALEKPHERVDKEALWSVLTVYGVGGRLLKGIKASYRGKMTVKMNGELSDSFDIGVGV